MPHAILMMNKHKQPTVLTHRIIEVEVLLNKLYRVKLQPLTNGLLFHAGQYIQLCLNDGSCLPFSIANAPAQDQHIELIIREQEDLPSQSLVKHITTHTKIDVQGPFGRCIYQSENLNPVLLIAGGTGITQIRSLLEMAVSEQDQRAWHLYWSVRDKKEIALINPSQWQHVLNHFQFSLPQDSRVYQSVTKDFPDLSSFQCYLSGPWSLIDKSVTHFKQHGLKLENIYSDRFDFL